MKKNIEKNYRKKLGNPLKAIVLIFAIFTVFLITIYNVENDKGVIDFHTHGYLVIPDKISIAKDEVESLVAQYASEYYEAKYVQNVISNNSRVADYIAIKIDGEVTKSGFEITTSDRDITVSKDDIIFEGTINDNGTVIWKKIDNYVTRIDSTEIEKLFKEEKYEK